MWLRFIVTNSSFKSHDVVFVEAYEDGVRLVDEGSAARCLGPEGCSFEEAAPEDVVRVISKDQVSEDQKKWRQGYFW